MLSFNVPSTPSSFYVAAIGTQGFIFSFAWQRRSKCWHMTVEDTDGVKVAEGVKLTIGVPLIRRNKSAFGEGNMFVVNFKKTDSEVPDRFNIGPNKAFELIYLSREEMGI